MPVKTVKTAFRIGLFLVLLPCLPARAADDANVAKIRGIVTDLMGDVKSSLSSNGSQLVSSGEIMVEPAQAGGKTYYAVTMPHLSVKSPDGGGANIGVIAMNVAPSKSPDLWTVTLSLPSPITFYERGGVPSAIMTVGRQNLTGKYHEKLRNLLSINANYSDIAITDPRSKDGITIGQITAKDGMVEDANHEWSGDTTYTIENLRFGAGKDSAGTIGKIAVLATVDRLNPLKLADYQDQMRAVAENMKGENGQDASLAHVTGLYNLVLGNLGAMWNGFDSTISIENIDIVAPSKDGDAGKRLKLAKAAFGMGMSGFRANDVSLSLLTQYDGFDVSVLPVEERASTPTSFKVDMKVEKLPYTKLVEMGRMALQAITKQPQNAQIVGVQMLAMLPKILTESATVVALKPSYAANADYRVDATGSFKPDMNAMLGGTGQANIQVFGFEKILAAMDAEAKNPKTDPQNAAKIKDTIRTLTALQLAGQQATDAQGRPIRTYAITLDPQGKSMLNGADMSALLPQPAAQQAQKENKKGQ